MARPPRRRPPRGPAFALVGAGVVRSTILHSVWIDGAGVGAPHCDRQARESRGSDFSIGGTLCIPGELVALRVTHGDCGRYCDRSDQDIGRQALSLGRGSGLIATGMFANALINVIDGVTA
jgi:hypothetical protein